MGLSAVPKHDQIGRKDNFLKYRHALSHFVYSFSWDITARTWQDLRDDLTVRKGWRLRRLHERIMHDSHLTLNYNYQPNVVFNTWVLEHSAPMLRQGLLLLPMERDRTGAFARWEQIPIDLWHTVRLFDNGEAACTFCVALQEDATSFRNIHAVLHLTQNVDRENESGPEQNENAPITQAFLQVPVGHEVQADLDWSLFPKSLDKCRLHDLFRNLLTAPPPWAPEAAKHLWDPTGTDGNGKSPPVIAADESDDFESPFLFTVAELDDESFIRFQQHSTSETNCEVASILCKMTLDNRHIETDFLHFSDNYLKYVLKYDEHRNTLMNLCLDDRLFFAISRRGAIAITSNLRGVPSYFVVPSLINLCEILRVRWHISNVVSARLDQEIARIAAGVDLSPAVVVEKMFKWRLMFAAFMRDPVPFLFDGGSITEVAELADREYWLSKLREVTYRKFEMLDKLVQDFLEKQRIEEIRRLRT